MPGNSFDSLMMIQQTDFWYLKGSNGDQYCHVLLGIAFLDEQVSIEEGECNCDRIPRFGTFLSDKTSEQSRRNLIGTVAVVIS